MENNLALANERKPPADIIHAAFSTLQAAWVLLDTLNSTIYPARYALIIEDIQMDIVRTQGRISRLSAELKEV
jgi:hypothetical protein